MSLEVPTAWSPAPTDVTFPEDRLDLWRVWLDSPDPNEGDLPGILTPDEVTRASRFHFENHRKRFVKCRSALRILLGRYLEIRPSEIRFQYSNNGKPEIAPPHHSRGLRFNVSNSGGLAMIAAGSTSAMGIDIEQVRPQPDLLDIARRFFSAREVQALLEVSEIKRLEAFFACWTRKEAILKASGIGLSYPLSGFSVSVDPDGPAELCEIEEGNALGRWFLIDIRPDEGYRGALAWEGGCQRIAQWDFS